MRKAKGKKKCVNAPAEPELEAARLILPASAVRRLVFQAILVEGIAPFVGRAVAVLDDLRAGRTDNLVPAVRRGRSKPSAELTAALSHAARQGRVREAEETAFYAASYAYRNSIDYFPDLLSYLDCFRLARTPRRREVTRAAPPGKRRR